MGFVVAIDGTAGSGKTTTAKEVSRRLGWLYLDTGATYRAVAYFVLKRGIDPKNEREVIQSLDNLKIEIKNLNGEQRTIVNGEDVTEKLRTEEINKAVTPISKIKEVRRQLVEIQRKIVNDKNAIVEGRDIGTVVFPDANIKFYMDADINVRAERRKQQEGLNNLEKVKEDLKRRDHHDSTRKESPLKRASDALFLDTSSLTIEEQVNIVISEIKKINEGFSSL
ncbi:MAG: (d)CMP kinase [candidate division WOR-3 bacterium]